MSLQDNELERIICYKLGHFGSYELQDEDLLEVKELNISNRSFSGKEKNINLAEIEKLKNLRSIFLQYFKIDDSIVSMLNSFEHLKSIYLASCQLDITKLLKNPALETLSLESCSIRDYSKISAPENFRVIGDTRVDLERLNGKGNIKRMYLQQCKVRGLKSAEKYPNLQFLNLDGSKIDNEQMLEKLKSTIQVSKQEEYLPIK